MKSTQHLLTIGKVCEILQRGPADIRAAMQAKGIKPALTINGLEYYDQAALGLPSSPARKNKNARAEVFSRE
jgi:hypothetical protein